MYLDFSNVVPLFLFSVPDHFFPRLIIVLVEVLILGKQLKPAPKSPNHPQNSLEPHIDFQFSHEQGR